MGVWAAGPARAGPGARALNPAPAPPLLLLPPAFELAIPPLGALVPGPLFRPRPTASEYNDGDFSLAAGVAQVIST